jgi:hypothetical protein
MYIVQHTDFVPHWRHSKTRYVPHLLRITYYHTCTAFLMRIAVRYASALISSLNMKVWYRTYIVLFRVGL